MNEHTLLVYTVDGAVTRVERTDTTRHADAVQRAHYGLPSTATDEEVTAARSEATYDCTLVPLSNVHDLTDGEPRRREVG
jgi:hypothetical protein